VQNAQIQISNREIIKKFISLFSGCGGSSLGYTLSGFKSIAAIDNNKLACDSYLLNFNDTLVLNQNINDIYPLGLLHTLRLNVGELDLLDASPPCQGFSIAGKRMIGDQRNDLFFQVKRFILELQPKTFIIENVDGLLKGPMKGIFNKIIDDLSTLNYRIKWKSLNSLYYGVPQSRQRVIIMGVREDLNLEPVFPEHEPTINFIGDVIPSIDFHSRGQFDKKLKGVNSFAYTVTKTPSMFFIENGLKRQPTIEELKILQGFPADFKLLGSFNDQWGLIGNSVPPPLTFRIGNVIRSEILNKVTSNIK
jgi:DNA (cytosine-5)-methyltransferase 1